ncbi:MAG TPA: VIT1/CCC1 transporter family protein [Gammaproteobacteria bacterium]|nr:VIT1/CCC1 transporter family protein [Gammaproteobacteria bacterium]
MIQQKTRSSGSAPGRPDSGIGHYLRDIVYGALDGVVTTLAIVSGTTGAALEPAIGLILGIANLVADGISMGASNYLGLKAELEQTGASVDREQPLRHGFATGAAFAAAGAVPLLAYLLPRPAGVTVFEVAVVLAALALFVTGVVRSRISGKRSWRSVTEVLAIGGVACAAAYGVGALAQWLI